LALLSPTIRDEKGIKMIIVLTSEKREEGSLMRVEMVLKMVEERRRMIKTL